MRYALVTGGSRGIGRAICCKLAEMGFYVLVNYNSSPDEAATTLNLVKEKRKRRGTAEVRCGQSGRSGNRDQ